MTVDGGDPGSLPSRAELAPCYSCIMVHYLMRIFYIVQKKKVIYIIEGRTYIYGLFPRDSKRGMCNNHIFIYLYMATNE